MQALPGQSVQERAAVITKGKLHVVVNFEPVRNIDLEPEPLIRALAQQAGTLGDDHLVAPLVDHAGAHLALVALLAQAPYEIPTVRTECRLLEVDSHELVTIDLVNTTPQRHPSLASPSLFFLEGSTRLVLFVLGGPLELNLDVELPIGLQLQPDVVKWLLCLLYQLWERQLAVGDEIIWRDRGVVEHSEPDLLGRPQQVRGESLVPVWVIGLPLCAGSLHVELVHVYSHVGVQVRLLARVTGHELGGLEVRGRADCHLQPPVEHGGAGWPNVINSWKDLGLSGYCAV